MYNMPLTLWHACFFLLFFRFVLRSLFLFLGSVRKRAHGHFPGTMLFARVIFHHDHHHRHHHHLSAAHKRPCLPLPSYCRSDCVPMMSLGSLYSLFRTIRNVDRLPLDVYKRAEFILDSRVRVRRSELGLDAETGSRERRERERERKAGWLF